MKLLACTSLIAAFLALSSIPAVAADPTHQRSAPVLTRTVAQFGGLENQWLDAVRARDRASLDKLVAPEFELRVAAAPGRPTPRAESLQRSLADPSFDSHIEQMAAHDYGTQVVVSFLWKITPPKGATLAARVFVVDTWKQKPDGWQVVARYAAPVAEDGTAGWQSVPGADLSAPEIEKKM